DPNSVRKSPIFLATLWFHAIDTSGDTLISVDLYHQNGTDFGQGVLPRGEGIGFTPAVDNRIFLTTQDEIERGRKLPSSLTKDIREWPAFYPYNGDTVKLAPFIDVNKDGKYNPELGDYPYTWGDQSVLFYYHDMVE